MPDTKSIRTRIKGVKSTLHLTEAMGTVASSKMRKANQAMQSAKEFQSMLDELIPRVAVHAKGHSYLREGGDRCKVIVIAGDRGMAGGYNANVFRTVAKMQNAEVVPIGKRACNKYGAQVCSSERFFADDAKRLADELCDQFRAGAFDRLVIVSSKYISAMEQRVHTEQILPLSAQQDRETEIVFEPSPEQVLDVYVPQYVAGKILCAVRESFACEITARKTAMDSAGKNAREMSDNLQLMYNRARQGAITQEITEILAGR
ncbi:MAG: ATP synthase F1 subunit gamma [Clostridia bacterium]|nr:ATP synthase F1 subunit gamma [Clostridia bacterium]